VLRQVEQRRGFSNRILSEHLERHPEMSRPDRGLATALVYGVLRERARLDHFIDAVAKKPSGIKGELRSILRIAVFELVVLKKPAAIVGAEASRTAKGLDRDGRLKRLITAIVANVDRRHAALEAELERADVIERLVVRWSVPRWLAARWVEHVGEATALCRAEAFSRIPALDLRVDLSRIERAAAIERLTRDHPGIEIEAPADQPATLRARGGGDVFFGPLHDDGLISVQALGSQRAVAALDPVAGERVWDACAGQGTKALQIAERMHRAGTLTATDADAERLDTLRETLARGRVPGAALSVEVQPHVLGDRSAALPPGAPFDAILVDAPCTGLGNLARHPELRWTTLPEDLQACAELQARVLAEAAQALAPDGRLVYAVCSLEPEEGAALVERMAPDLALSVELTETWTPEAHDADGFFLALLRPRHAAGGRSPA